MQDSGNEFVSVVHWMCKLWSPPLHGVAAYDENTLNGSRYLNLDLQVNP